MNPPGDHLDGLHIDDGRHRPRDGFGVGWLAAAGNGREGGHGCGLCRGGGGPGNPDDPLVAQQFGLHHQEVEECRCQACGNDLRDKSDEVVDRHGS